MPPVTIWVAADRDDPTLAVLADLPADAVCIVGAEATDFVGRPAPDILFFCKPSPRLFQAMWAVAPRGSVRWVHSRYAGVDHVLFPALVESDVPLSAGRGLFSSALGEFVLYAILHFEKQTRRMLDSQARAAWEPLEVGEVHGKTLGIVGYGSIGQAVARRARPFGVKVLGLRRSPAQSADDPLVDEVLEGGRLHELLSRSDYVVLAAPLTGTTRHLIDAAALAAMRPGAILVNVGRGPLIDEEALVACLRAGHLGGAALDVFAKEPLPPSHALWGLDNVLISPHSADRVPGWLEAPMRRFVDNVGRFQRGEPLEGLVDKLGGY